MKPVEADQTKDQGVAGEVRRKSSLKFVTAVTHISQWSPPKVGGTALVCIGELEYSKPTWCDQNDLYLMKRYPTVAAYKKMDCPSLPLSSTETVQVMLHSLNKTEYNGKIGTITKFNTETDRFVVVLNGRTKGMCIKSENLIVLKLVTDANQKDEFMVSFVDANLQKEDAEFALEKMRVGGNERIVKHVGKLETCMNGDVTRNFRMKDGFCGDADGLYKIVPGQSFEKLDVFDENGLTIKKLFETMRENECDYLVVIGKESTETFTVHVDGVLRERLERLTEETFVLNKQWEETPDGNEKNDMLIKGMAQQKSMQELAKQIKEEEESSTSKASAPVRGDKPILKPIKREGETKELDSVSQWKPPVMNGRALIAFGHSSLGNDAAARNGYSMKKDEFMVSYTDPLCTLNINDMDAAIDSTKRNNVVPGRINSAFIARINGDWTPNYILACVKDDVANKKGYMGLWILDPVNQSMTQIDNWKDGKETNVKDLFLKMKEQECDYLVILGCKSGAGSGAIRNARIEMLRVVQEMKDYSNDLNLQAWGICKIIGLESSCELKEWESNQCKLICCAVIEGLKKHGESNVNVAKNGCFALGNLASNHAENKGIIGTEGGISVIIQMIKKHGESNVAVAKYGCWALMNLAMDNGENSTIIGTEGGISVLIQMMKGHGESNKDVAINGCMTLYYLSFENTSNQKKDLLKRNQFLSLINKLKQRWSPHDIGADLLLEKLKDYEGSECTII